MKIVENIKKNLKWIIFAISVISFLIVAEDVLDKDIMEWDIASYNVIDKYLISDFATPIAKFITHLGGATCLIGIMIILFILIRNKRINISITLNLILATLLNIFLKNIVQRPRPIEYRIIDDTGYSFPSGHSMISAAFYGYIIYLVYKYIKNKYLKWSLITFFTILIISIGTSRIYLGVHYTSDVLAGFLISISYLIIYTNIMGKYMKKE